MTVCCACAAQVCSAGLCRQGPGGGTC